MESSYRFSFGPWNIDESPDPFGPPARELFPHEKKFALYKPLGFDGVQFHDDDVVPGLENLSAAQIERKSAEVRKMLDDHGLVAEFVAPRMWFVPETIDGGYTSNRASDREYARQRALRSVDIAKIVGAKSVGLWLAREGTYIRESKDPRTAYQRLLDLVNELLEYDKEIEVWIEPKPNEPMDHAYVPTMGHAVALAYASNDPKRVKCIMESAHAILAGLDPGDEMAFALNHGMLGSVHLNDQNGLKFDQDKSFGSVNLRRAFHQVRVLDDAGYGKNGEFVGLDVKAIRAQPGTGVTAHLSNSRATFLFLLEKVRSWDRKAERQYIEARDYEGLDAAVLRHLLNV